MVGNDIDRATSTDFGSSLFGITGMASIDMRLRALRVKGVNEVETISLHPSAHSLGTRQHGHGTHSRRVDKRNSSKRASRQQRTTASVFSKSALRVRRTLCISISMARLSGSSPLLHPSVERLGHFDTVPLQDPRKGWKANVALWVRFFIGALIIGGAILIQARLVIPNLGLTTKQIVAIVLGVGVGYASALMLIAELWMFPVPFIYAIGGIPFIMMLNTLVTISLGKANKEQLAKFFKFTNGLSVQSLMSMMYPVYNAIFLTLDGDGQLAFVLLLPPMKIFLKYLTAKMNPIDGDLLPATMSSVDIFDAMYMTKCMQSANSLKAGCAIILVDFLQNYWAIRHRLDSSVLRFGDAQSAVSEQARKELDRLDSVREAMPVTPAVPKKLFISPLSTISGRLFKKTGLIAPSKPSPTTLAQVLELKESTKEAKVIKDTVALLHASEAVAMIEYIEAVVPIIYALYIAILFHLPNARYYQDMDGFTEHKLKVVVVNILVYGVMEILSLLHVEHKINRQFGVSIFYQLAFALENEWQIYQCCFLSWIIVVFQFLLVHGGVDFSFKFAWAHTG
ncbi:hypothetical protein FI667_g12264, partial [Globisporangium splendens]